MKIEAFKCGICGRVQLMAADRVPQLRPNGEVRVPTRGGENLTGYGGGQTHDWAGMSLVGVVEFTPS